MAYCDEVQRSGEQGKGGEERNDALLVNEVYLTNTHSFPLHVERKHRYFEILKPLR